MASLQLAEEEQKGALQNLNIGACIAKDARLDISKLQAALTHHRDHRKVCTPSNSLDTRTYIEQGVWNKDPHAMKFRAIRGILDFAKLKGAPRKRMNSHHMVPDMGILRKLTLDLEHLLFRPHSRQPHKTLN